MRPLCLEIRDMRRRLRRWKKPSKIRNQRFGRRHVGRLSALEEQDNKETNYASNYCQAFKIVYSSSTGAPAVRSFESARTISRGARFRRGSLSRRITMTPG